MSNRRPFPIRAGVTLAAAAALITACGMPQAMDPPPPPMAEAPPPPMLYGEPEGADPYGMPGAMAQGPCLNDPYPAAVPPPACDFDPAMGDDAERAAAEARGDAFAPPPPPFARAEEIRRPGWGTMAPVPNPGDAGERGLYAERAPYREMEPVPYAPRGYVEVRPSREGEAVFAEGVPVAGERPLVVTMEPVPNPSGTTRAGVDDGETQTPPRRQRARRASDQGLLGGPAVRPSAPARQAAAAPARRPAAAPTAAPARPPQRAAAPAPTAPKPAAQTARRNGTRGLEHFRNVLSQLVQRDSTLAAPAEVVPGRTEEVTLTLPATLAETMAREARAAGMRDGAAGAQIRAQLTGEGWAIEPGEPQSTAVRAGRTSTFSWRATPEAGAGRLQAQVDAQLPRGGRSDTLNLAQLNGPELAGAGEGAAATGGGLSARAIAAGVLLLLALLAAFWFLRKRDGSPATVGTTRRRRYREPVNLTPYAPNADTPAPTTGSTST